MSAGVMKHENPILIDLHVSHTQLLFIITEKARAKERKWHGVGVMKDKELLLFIMNR